MKLRHVIAGLSMAIVVSIAALAPAAAQRGDDDRWELLAEENVGIGSDRDVINLKQGEDHYRNKTYRRLRLVAEGGEVRMNSLRLIYMNGFTEDVRVERDIRPGQQLDIDLAGDRAYLRQIVLNYGSKFGFSFGNGGIRLNQATMKIFGESSRGGPPPERRRDDDDRQRMRDIGHVSFDRLDRQVLIGVGRRPGRIGPIALQSSGDVIRVLEARIRFSGGDQQVVPINQELRNGERTAPIILTRERRNIEDVTVILEPRRRPGTVTLSVLGTEWPREDEAPANNWQPIGNVGFDRRDDRTQIRVGRREGRVGQIALQATGEVVKVIEVRVRFDNDERQVYPVGAEIRDGQRTPVIDLGGDRRRIEEVTVVLEPRRRPGPATLTLLGNERGRY